MRRNRKKHWTINAPPGVVTPSHPQDNEIEVLLEQCSERYRKRVIARPQVRVQGRPHTILEVGYDGGRIAHNSAIILDPGDFALGSLAAIGDDSPILQSHHTHVRLDLQAEGADVRN